MLSTLRYRNIKTIFSKVNFRYLQTGKDIIRGESARTKIMKGIDTVTDSVQATLGPKGRNVVIEQSFGTPKITKDGVTVASSIFLTDPHQNIGCQFIKSVASKANDVAGDGTTTATVLARSMCSAGCRSVAAGLNPMDLKRGILACIKIVAKELKKNSKLITSKEQIKQVATISANGEKSIGDMIGNAMEKVGTDGIITVEDGQKSEDELSVVKGMKFDRGYIHPLFVTNQKTSTTEFDNPYILVVDSKITYYDGIVGLLEEIRSNGKSLLIIAEDVDGEALSILLLNKIKIGIKVCAVKAPGFGDNRKSNLEDIAIMTGAHLFTEHSEIKLKDVKIEHCGRCSKAEISKETTIILEGKGDKEKIKERTELLNYSIKNNTSKYENEKLKERLGKMHGGVAVIKVGGDSEVEISEKKDRVTDALNATQAASQDGIVPGGGVALLYSSHALKDYEGENESQKMGKNIVMTALKMPAKVICDNAGMEGSYLTAKLLEKSNGSTKCTEGIDAQKGKSVDMMEAGITDPVKVVITALVNAGSVAANIITTELSITDKIKDEQTPTVPPQPPMGGY